LPFAATNGFQSTDVIAADLLRNALGPVEYQGCGAGLTGLAQIHGAEEEGHAGIFDDEAA